MTNKLILLKSVTYRVGVTNRHKKSPLLTAVALSAVTDDLVRGVVGVAWVTIEMIWAGVTRAGAGPTVIPGAKHWISKEPIHTTG